MDHAETVSTEGALKTEVKAELQSRTYIQDSTKLNPV